MQLKKIFRFARMPVTSKPNQFGTNNKLDLSENEDVWC